jgi:hypothetical protein
MYTKAVLVSLLAAASSVVALPSNVAAREPAQSHKCVVSSEHILT